MRLAPALPWLALAACAPHAGPEARPNLVLVTLDTTRADVLADERAAELAPHLRALADGGVAFPHAYSVAPLTLPAHASLLSGLIPPVHGVRDNGRTAMPEQAELLPELLQSAGYATAAFVSSVVLDRGFGLEQGFERYDQPELDASEAHLHVERPAAETIATAIAWLDAREDERPFFLWTHLYDAHLPYRPAPAPLARAAGDPYRGEIAALDDACGELFAALERLGLDEQTLIVVTADHGESLGEHGEPTHGALCYEATLRIPLVFRFPGAPPTPGPARFASLVDVVPTVLARLGLPLPPDLDGHDLFDPAHDPKRGVYFESLSGHLNYGWSPLCGWLDGRGKYLHSSRPEFYQPLSDPLERHDLATSHAREVELALTRLRNLLARPPLPLRTFAESEELERALASLGYARGPDWEAPARVDLLAPSTAPAPHERTMELAPLLEASALLEAGRAAECLARVDELLAGNPRNSLALDLAALSCMQLGDFVGAERRLRQRLAAGEVADAHLNLGLALAAQGRNAEAVAELERAQALVPGSVTVARELERLRARGGR